MALFGPYRTLHLARPGQITITAPHHSVFTGQMPFLLSNQQRQSTGGTQMLLLDLYLLGYSYVDHTNLWLLGLLLITLATTDDCD